MVEDLVVVGEVIGGDNVDARILLDFPVSEAESLALREEVALRDLVGPVGLGGLLEVSQGAHTGEAQDGRANHRGSIGKRGKGRLKSVFREEAAEDGSRERGDEEGRREGAEGGRKPEGQSERASLTVSSLPENFRAPLIITL